MAHAASQLKKKADLDLTALEEEKEKKKKSRKRIREPKKKVLIGQGSEGCAFLGFLIEVLVLACRLGGLSGSILEVWDLTFSFLVFVGLTVEELEMKTRN